MKVVKRSHCTNCARHSNYTVLQKENLYYMFVVETDDEELIYRSFKKPLIQGI